MSGVLRGGKGRLTGTEEGCDGLGGAERRVGMGVGVTEVEMFEALRFGFAPRCP